MILSWAIQKVGCLHHSLNLCCTGMVNAEICTEHFRMRKWCPSCILSGPICAQRQLFSWLLDSTTSDIHCLNQLKSNHSLAKTDLCHRKHSRTSELYCLSQTFCGIRIPLSLAKSCLVNEISKNAALLNLSGCGLSWHLACLG